MANKPLVSLQFPDLSDTYTIPTDAADVGAVAADQGVANAGKFLVVGNDGLVSPVSVPAATGVNF